MILGPEQRRVSVEQRNMLADELGLLRGHQGDDTTRLPDQVAAAALTGQIAEIDREIADFDQQNPGAAPAAGETASSVTGQVERTGFRLVSHGDGTAVYSAPGLRDLVLLRPETLINSPALGYVHRRDGAYRWVVDDAAAAAGATLADTATGRQAALRLIRRAVLENFDLTGWMLHGRTVLGDDPGAGEPQETTTSTIYMDDRTGDVMTAVRFDDGTVHIAEHPCPEDGWQAGRDGPLLAALNRWRA